MENISKITSDLITAVNLRAKETELSAHTGKIDNPHTVTKAQVGLSDVDNTNDLDKPISTATQTAINLKANQSTTYTKDAINTFLEDKADKDTTYTPGQIDALNNTQDLENFLNFKF